MKHFLQSSHWISSPECRPGGMFERAQLYLPGNTITNLMLDGDTPVNYGLYLLDNPVQKLPVIFDTEKKETTSTKIILKTLGFTYLNAHVYSDTVFFLGNFSKNFLFDEKIYFGVGASTASFIFFFLLGYLSVYFSKYAQSDKIWKYINGLIIGFMSLLTIYIIKETIYFL